MNGINQQLERLFVEIFQRRSRPTCTCIEGHTLDFTNVSMDVYIYNVSRACSQCCVIIVEDHGCQLLDYVHVRVYMYMQHKNVEGASPS